jgi:hypothetical protein
MTITKQSWESFKLVQTTREISSFADAVGYLPLHEAYHFASIKTLMNSLKVQQKVE